MSKYLNQCPECKSQDVECHKKVGCFFIVFLFISMGLGLVMYPFLPKECTCKKCRLKWKI